MDYYDYGKFVHPVPAGHIIPKGTPTRSVEFAPPVETFFTPLHDVPVESEDEAKYYLTYDITAPKLPETISSVIYNVHAVGEVFPVAVYQGSRIWSAFSNIGERTSLYTPEIVSFTLESTHD